MGLRFLSKGNFSPKVVSSLSCQIYKGDSLVNCKAITSRCSKPLSGLAYTFIQQTLSRKICPYSEQMYYIFWRDRYKDFQEIEEL